jgi:transcriptional regulator with PAS, ATPase and Fis domain
MKSIDVQAVKQRYGIIGSSKALDRAIEVAALAAPTELSVLIQGESGTGKEVLPQIIHQLSPRKHGPYNALNCGAIPEGTIDSELFGHEKGSFTGAHEARKGYFEVSNGGTLFLDEVGELPLSTQVRLLRVLETGEFIRVGSSKAQKTNVRVVAATNVEMVKAMANGTFREDLYYRLAMMSIKLPPLRERREDILLLFRKFAADSAERYRIKDPLRLSPEAQQLITSYRWPGNIRQLRNVVEQMNVIEQDREIDTTTLREYLPDVDSSVLPALVNRNARNMDDQGAVLNLITELTKQVNALRAELDARTHGHPVAVPPITPAYREDIIIPAHTVQQGAMTIQMPGRGGEPGAASQDVTHEVVEETLSLEEKEKEMIRKALIKHRGRRKSAAQELGISERTLYRKINEYNIT